MSPTAQPAGQPNEPRSADAYADDARIVDPDLPHDWPHESAFAFGDATPIGETERLAAQRAAYEAAGWGSDRNRGHALGGSAGTTEGM